MDAIVLPLLVRDQELSTWPADGTRSPVTDNRDYRVAASCPAAATTWRA
jgi:hypothetical protein